MNEGTAYLMSGLASGLTPGSALADEIIGDQDDIGVSIPDAMAIKSAILRTIEHQVVEPGDFYTLAEDLLSAFKAIDNDVFIRSEQERKANQNKSLTKTN